MFGLRSGNPHANDGPSVAIIGAVHESADNSGIVPNHHFDLRELDHAITFVAGRQLRDGGIPDPAHAAAHTRCGKSPSQTDRRSTHRHSIDEALAARGDHDSAMRPRRFDYSRSGAYFVTFCIADRNPMLAEVIGDRLRLTAPGKIVACAWPLVLARYPHVRLLESVVMPDHVQALLRFDATGGPEKSMNRLIGAVKTRSAARINRLRESPGSPVWQSGFYDRIIRSPEMLATVREYIRNNPRHWLERLKMK